MASSNKNISPPPNPSDSVHENRVSNIRLVTRFERTTLVNTGVILHVAMTLFKTGLVPRENRISFVDSQPFTFNRIFLQVREVEREEPPFLKAKHVLTALSTLVQQFEAQSRYCEVESTVLLSYEKGDVVERETEVGFIKLGTMSFLDGIPKYLVM